MRSSSKRGWENAIQLVLRLGRLKMTVFSAVTYATAVNVGTQLTGSDLDINFSTSLFLSGWAFVFFTQLVAHFLGEYYDYTSDKLNVLAGPMTGGSKVLVTGEMTLRQCFAMGYCCFAVACTILFALVPSRCWPIGCILVFIAHQYSAPPFKLNHRGLGELAASTATNILLPQFAVLIQSASLAAPVFHWTLSILVVPSFFMKVALFVALNIADRRSDWLGGKYTIPVLVGDATSSRILGACYVLGYMSSVIIFIMGMCPATTLVAVLLSMPEGYAIARLYNPDFEACGGHGSREDEGGGRPYRYESLVRRVLAHAPGVVVAIFVDGLLRHIMGAGSEAIAAAGEESITAAAWAWIAGVSSRLLSTDQLVLCLPVVPFVFLFMIRKGPPRSAAGPSASVRLGPSAADKSLRVKGVLVAGGGVGGLVLGACLQELGIPFEIIEKRRGEDSDKGADLALWPAAAKILKEIGVGTRTASGSPDFWTRHIYPVHRVRIAKVDVGKEPDRASPVEGTDAVAATPDILLKEVDMDAVVDEEGESFCLVSRNAVMSALAPLIAKENIKLGYRVDTAEQASPECQSAAAYVSPVNETDTRECTSTPYSCRVLVGADGIYSVCRLAVSAAARSLADNLRAHGDGDGVAASTDIRADKAAGLRDGGEVCYRGAFDLRHGSPAAREGLRSLFERDEKERPHTMSIVYGDRMRYSWGLIDGAGDAAYWFVKQLKTKKDDTDRRESVENSLQRVGQRWPEPLRTFAKVTPSSYTYVHPIQERPPLSRWSSSNITLLGDACHPATPNNGQGACMAIEDAFVLATLLGEFWDEADGHIEAFYLYEQARLQHTKGIQRESYKQMKLGQLTSRVGIWIREFAIRKIPASVLQKKLRKSNKFDIKPWLERFREVKAKRQQK